MAMMQSIELSTVPLITEDDESYVRIDGKWYNGFVCQTLFFYDAGEPETVSHGHVLDMVHALMVRA